MRNYKGDTDLKTVILDAATLGDDIDLSPIYEVSSVTEYPFTPVDMIADRLKDADVVVTNKLKLGETNLASASSLKLICVTATGYDNIDVEYCKQRGIALYNVPKYSTDSVAQLSISMVLYLATHLGSYRDYVHSGEYTASGIANKLTPVYHELSSMTWGIVGGGEIGSAVAKVATAFGCKVLMCRRQPDERYETCDIDTLCQRSDIISLHVPLNDGTRGMISKERIDMMRDGVILVNVARGAVTDEEAVTRAVESGKIGGLGVDVFTKEPFDKDHPYNRILGRENVCLTPHMAWGSYEARNRCIRIVADNIKSFEAGNKANRII